MVIGSLAANRPQIGVQFAEPEILPAIRLKAGDRRLRHPHAPGHFRLGKPGRLPARLEPGCEIRVGDLLPQTGHRLRRISKASREREDVAVLAGLSRARGHFLI